MLKFPLTFALDFPYVCLQFFPENFSSNEEKFLQTNVLKILKVVKVHVTACTALKSYQHNR